MGEFHMYSLGGSKRHMSAGSSAKMRNDAKAVVKSAKISSTNRVRRGESVSPPTCKPLIGRIADEVSGCHSDSNKENTTVLRGKKKLPSSAGIFGYDIDNLSSFLGQATSRTPANIPMVVTSRTELYVLEPPATPEEPTVPIHLGLVVNALFKHRQWLYVQTPHNQEGYLAYSACMPLGIIPRHNSWETDQCKTLEVEGMTAACAVNKGKDTFLERTPYLPPVEPAVLQPAAQRESAGTPASRRPPLQNVQSTRCSDDGWLRQRPPLPPPLSQSDTDRESGEEVPPCRRQSHQRAPSLAGADPATAPLAHANKTDAEKMYENVTADGRALGLLLERHLRQGRARSRQRGRSHSAGRRTSGELRSRPRRDQSAPGGEQPQQMAPPLERQDALDGSRPSAFHRLKPSSPPASKSVEALRQVEAPSHPLVAPRSNNKAVIWKEFASRGRNTLTVKPGDIVILLNTSVGDWFWVKDAVGKEGYIPSICVGSGPL